MLQRIALFVSISAVVVCTLGQTRPEIGIEGGEIRVELAKNGAAVTDGNLLRPGREGTGGADAVIERRQAR